MTQPICIFITLALFSTGCATMNKSQCRLADWEQVGRADGERGHRIEYQTNHIEACGEVATFDADAYNRGWADGRNQYCTPENAYMIGIRGITPEGVCPETLRSAFEERYKQGRSVYLLSREREELRKTRDERKKEIAADHSVLNDITQAIHLVSGESSTPDLDRKEASLSREITGLRAAAPVTYASAEPMEGISDYLGAFLGTGIGFGVGHAIQGRYGSSGWMWTLGEAAAITAMGVSSHNCPKPARASSDGNARGCSGALPLLALGSWIGVRIWQSVDLWKYAYQNSQGYRFDTKTEKTKPLSLGLMPNGIGFSTTFD
jgi:hypothetical protein